jgi:hypothetical protein
MFANTPARRISWKRFSVRVNKVLRPAFGNTFVLVYIGIISAFVIPIMTLIAYVVFSGRTVTLLGTVLYQFCSATGTCGNFPLVLTFSFSGLLLFVAILSIVIRPIFVLGSKSADKTDPVSITRLLIIWFRLSGRERSQVLKLLRSSEFDVSDTLIDNLEIEHLELERSGAGLSADILDETEPPYVDSAVVPEMALADEKSA